MGAVQAGPTRSSTFNIFYTQQYYSNFYQTEEAKATHPNKLIIILFFKRTNTSTLLLVTLSDVFQVSN